MKLESSPFPKSEGLSDDEALAAVDGFIWKHARRYATSYQIEPDDMVQAAKICALKAAKTWRANRGTVFLTYAARFMVFEMRRVARDIVDPVHVPTHQLNKMMPWRILINAPSNEDEPESCSKAETRSDLACHQPSADELVGQEDERNFLLKSIAALSPKQRSVIERRFFSGETRDRIGLDYGIGREGIRQIELKALEELRLSMGAPSRLSFQ